MHPNIELDIYYLSIDPEAHNPAVYYPLGLSQIVSCSLSFIAVILCGTMTKGYTHVLSSSPRRCLSYLFHFPTIEIHKFLCHLPAVLLLQTSPSPPVIIADQDSRLISTALEVFLLVISFLSDI